MLDFMKAGGAAMWLIAACGLVATIIVIERLFHLHRAQIKTNDFLSGIYNLLKRDKIVEAVSICEETPGPAAYIVKNAVLHYDEDPSAIEHAVQEAGRIEVPRLEKRLSLLATLAQITPMIGLFGTVLGLINALLTIQQKAPLVQAGDLSGAMWEALLSTAAGLGVAIPAYVAYNLLVGRVQAILWEMEYTAAEIVSFLTRRRKLPEDDA